MEFILPPSLLYYTRPETSITAAFLGTASQCLVRRHSIKHTYQEPPTNLMQSLQCVSTCKIHIRKFYAKHYGIATRKMASNKYCMSRKYAPRTLSPLCICSAVLQGYFYPAHKPPSHIWLLPKFADNCGSPVWESKVIPSCTLNTSLCLKCCIIAELPRGCVL